MSDPHLRDYEERDREALARMAEEVVRDGTVFPFEDPAGVFGYWFGEGTHCVVAELEGRVVGTYVLKPNHPGRGAHVCNAGYLVSESARGRGVGEALARHSLARAADLGYLAMQFNQVVSTNRAAVRLWEKLGFERLAELPDTFRHPELGFVSTLVMYRRLQP